MNDFMRRHFCYLSIFLFSCASCGKRETALPTVKHTPIGARVDLDQVSLEVKNAKIIRQDNNNHLIRFQCRINNQSGSIISFPCLYHRIDELIEVTLTNNENKRLTIGRRPLEGLTLTEPRPLKIALNKTSVAYEASIVEPLINSNEPFEMRVRLHAPSRYDELRSSIEANKNLLLWP